jgi:hypothetical protein
MATAAAWNKLLPKLVYPFMGWQEAAMSGRGPPEGEAGQCGECLNASLQAEVNVVSFMGTYPRSYSYLGML